MKSPRSAPRVQARRRIAIVRAKAKRHYAASRPALKPRTTSPPPSRARVPSKALIDFTRSFAVMLRARLSLVQSLETAAGQCINPVLMHILEVVRRDVQRGRSLSDSLAQHERVFSSLYVHLARIGERAGVLDEVMIRLASHLEKAAALKRKVRFAMFYPGLIVTVALGATLFFLTAIVPTFAEMYADFDQELPGPTQVVLALSQTLTENFIVGLIGSGSLMLGMRLFLRTPGGRLIWDRSKLRVPVLGDVLRKSLSARFCRTLGTLLSNGVPLLDALSILAKASDNLYIEQVLSDVLGRVRRGSSLCAPLEKGGFLPAMVVQLIAVGEQTAELDRMLLHAAAYYEQEVDSSLDGLTSIIEPVLIVAIGLVLGGILVALYLPLFDLINTVG